MLNDVVLTAISFCANTANVWQIIGYVLLVFKIVIPILLILFGTLDLGKAVVASKDDEISKAAKHLAFRAAAAIIIFFIPTIVGLIMSMVSNFSKDARDDYNVCKNCIVSPSEGECVSAAEEAWNANIPDE